MSQVKSIASPAPRWVRDRFNISRHAAKCKQWYRARKKLVAQRGGSSIKATPEQLQRHSLLRIPHGLNDPVVAPGRLGPIQRCLKYIDKFLRKVLFSLSLQDGRHWASLGFGHRCIGFGFRWLWAAVFYSAKSQLVRAAYAENTKIGNFKKSAKAEGETLNSVVFRKFRG